MRLHEFQAVAGRFAAAFPRLMASMSARVHVRSCPCPIVSMSYRVSAFRRRWPGQHEGRRARQGHGLNDEDDRADLEREREPENGGHRSDPNDLRTPADCSMPPPIADDRAKHFVTAQPDMPAVRGAGESECRKQHERRGRQKGQHNANGAQAEGGNADGKPCGSDGVHHRRRVVQCGAGARDVRAKAPVSARLPRSRKRARWRPRRRPIRTLPHRGRWRRSSRRADRGL